MDTSLPSRGRRFLKRPVRFICLFSPALLCAGQVEPLPAAPELVLVHGRVLAGNAGKEPLSALAIGGGRILRIGSDEDILGLKGFEARVIDLGGAVVAPAFADHHVHLLNLGLSILNSRLEAPLFVDLSGIPTLDLLKQRLIEQDGRLSEGSWLLGKGWNQASWGPDWEVMAGGAHQGLPLDVMLSQLFPARPVFLSRTDGHAGWINQSAMLRAGITRRTPDPPGGRIIRLADGKPSGILLEKANELVGAKLPAIPDELLVRALRMAARTLAEQGFTRVYDAGFLTPPGIVGLHFDFARVVGLLVEEDRKAPLPIEVNLMIPAPSPLARKVLAQRPGQRRLSDRIRVTHLKLFADGAMGSWGAALSHPFADQSETRGVPRMSKKEIREWSLKALDAGLDVATHAIGDAAIQAVLDAYEEVLRRRPGTPPGRLRIEHFSYASGADMERAARLKVTLSIQPNFIYPDAEGLAMEDARVGPENSSRVYAWATLEKLGARLAGGSDYFGHPGPPLLTFYSALTRSNPEGQPAAGWHPEERLSRRSALELMWGFYPAGGGAALSGFGEGTPADLVLLSGDPAQLPDSEILGIRVLATLRGGRVVAGSLDALH